MYRLNAKARCYRNLFAMHLSFLLTFLLFWSILYIETERGTNAFTPCEAVVFTTSVSFFALDKCAKVDYNGIGIRCGLCRCTLCVALSWSIWFFFCLTFFHGNDMLYYASIAICEGNAVLASWSLGMLVFILGSWQMQENLLHWYWSETDTRLGRTPDGPFDQPEIQFHSFLLDKYRRVGYTKSEDRIV